MNRLSRIIRIALKAVNFYRAPNVTSALKAFDKVQKRLVKVEAGNVRELDDAQAARQVLYDRLNRMTQEEVVYTEQIKRAQRIRANLAQLMGEDIEDQEGGA